MNNSSFGEAVLRHRWPIVVLTLLVVTLFAYQIRNIQMTDDLNVFFSEDNPQLLALDRFKDTYGETKNAFIAIAPANGDIFTQTNLALLEELTYRGWEVPYSRRVDSLQNFQRTRVYEDDLEVDNTYQDAQTLTPEEIKDLRDYAIDHDVIGGQLISADGSLAAMSITFNITDGPGAKEKRQEVIDYLTDLMDELKGK
ncbi:MAG: hypothetical protein KUG80_08920, partial [Gammaproteobacteria bacterium]|nr:hypothetical protein [Gammaproteobacteria bacterium]